MGVLAKISGFLGVAGLSTGTYAQNNVPDYQFERINTVLATPLIDLPRGTRHPDLYIKNSIDVVLAWAKANDGNALQKLVDLRHEIEKSALWDNDNPAPLNEYTERVLLKDFIYRAIGESAEKYLGPVAFLDSPHKKL